MKKLFCLAIIVLLTSCSSTTLLLQKKNGQLLNGCYSRIVDITKVKSFIGNSYGREAQGQEYICIESDVIMRGLFVKRLENSFVEDGYRFYEQEYAKQLKHHLDKGLDESTFMFDEVKLFKNIDEKNYDYV